MGLIKETSYDARGPGCKARNVHGDAPMYVFCACACACTGAIVRSLHVYTVSVHPNVALIPTAKRLSIY